MKVLVFDTETTGLPEDKSASLRDTEKWPHILQLAFILYDTVKCKCVASHDYIINIPDHVEISWQSEEIHGITREISNKKGIPIRLALEEFNDCLKHADILVAHNLSFDKKIVLSSCFRENIKPLFYYNGIPIVEYCTMKKTVDFPVVLAKNSKGETYNKFPKLAELHEYLFGVRPDGLHDAYIDILVCLRCYIKLEENLDILDGEGSVINKLREVLK